MLFGRLNEVRSAHDQTGLSSGPLGAWEAPLVFGGGRIMHGAAAFYRGNAILFAFATAFLSC
jgi:hypothetical protein